MLIAVLPVPYDTIDRVCFGGAVDPFGNLSRFLPREFRTCDECTDGIAIRGGVLCPDCQQIRRLRAHQSQAQRVIDLLQDEILDSDDDTNASAA